MADPGRLSPSKITTYEGCSLAYYLQYVEHVKVPTHIRLAFGKRSHYMLNHFYDVNFKSDESFLKFWVHDWFAFIAGDYLKGKERETLKMREYPYYAKDKETGKRLEKILRVGSHVDLGPNPVGVHFGYLKLGKTIFRNFYRRHKNKHAPLERERHFGKRKDEVILLGNHELTGIFDRIDKIDGKWYITDYKTDKASPGVDSFILHRHPQFTLYSYVFRQLFGVEETAILYYHLRSGRVFKTHRGKKDYDYLRGLIDRVSKGIENNEFDPFYGFHCNFCDLKVACEQYSSTFHGGPRIDFEGEIKRAEEFTDWYDPDIEIPGWMTMIEEV